MFFNSLLDQGLRANAGQRSRRKVHKFSVLFAPASAASQCAAKVCVSAGNSAWKGGNGAYYVVL